MEKSKPKNNGSFVFYESFYASAEAIGPEFLHQAVMHLVRYGLYGIEPNLNNDPVMAALWMNWKPLIDATQQKKKGGAPRGNQNARGHKGAGGRPKKKTSTKLQPSDVDVDVDAYIDAYTDTSANADEGLPPYSPNGGERATAPSNEGDDEWVFDPEVAEREREEWLKSHGLI